ncbi:MAG: RNA-binding protein [Pseudomonadales bacterium]|nr:RNA-binding protein [Pseudomonadales bacterium]NIX08196.1 RNA-binding protein [Pseudomonadales bacterium]
MKLYVGNLPWSTTDSDLEDLFSSVGPVSSAQVITDRDTGRSRGFGFVAMSDEDASRAITELNGHAVDGRQIKVNQANDKPRRASGF